MVAPKQKKVRIRGEALKGKGYGANRYMLFTKAKQHIERSLARGFNCEAIAVVESVISDRMGSRLSYLTTTNVGFQTLGYLAGQLKQVETDTEMRLIIDAVDQWRKRRNEALHELVKVEADEAFYSWDVRMKRIAASATDGYTLLKQLYHRVADLNPKHSDRVFDLP